ncbi:zinc-binding dehydrogenase [Gordonia sp. TBRC 11910]|uniref:alcohol dehydrogenase n=1 Tax=Gordonia asplenii TaxID=2725283 RepID=A0A848KTI1_9ACTN|nr:zinc-binding dehydrogenase [Gordonia asplenii]NMO02006.1 zinc-binding dehydrogenase [Gordonia asplenii]
MRAMVIEAPNTPLISKDVPDPVAGNGETIIDVTACGVCHSDLHVVEGSIGRTPLILGHEVVGVDADLGPVLVYAPWGCRKAECAQCSAGLEMICADSHEAGVLDPGGYAPRMRIPHREYLLPLDGLDPVTTAPLACGGLTAFRAVRRAIGLSESSTARRKALVVGAGGLGQYAVQYLKLLADAHVTVVDTLPARQATALELGADAAGTFDDVAGEKFDSIIDFVGADATLAGSAKVVARGGVVVLVGMFGGTVPFGFGHLPSEASFTTSVWGSLDDLRELLDLARREKLVNVVETMPLAAANEAHQRLRDGTARGRIVLTMN